MDLGQLNWHSRSFAVELFRAHPDWRQFGRVERLINKALGYLIVEVAGPSGSRLDHPLLITTDNEEVTISLDHFHQHFDWPPQNHLLDPLLFLATLLCDEMAVVSYWKDGKWVESTVLDADEQAIPEPGIMVRVRSWNGTRDLDLRS
jgi:hypothetical protein